MGYQVNVKEKIAIVTGGLSGIGLGIAKALAECSADVVIMDVKETGELSSKFKEVADRVTYYKADITKQSSVEKVVKRIINKLGKIDILVNNAGVAHVDPIGEINFDNWSRLMEVNLKGPVVCANSVVPHMKQARWGRIINIASVAGIVGLQTYSAYGASKAGIRLLSKTWAAELAPYDITVNSISPGWVKTSLLPNFINRMAALHQISVEEALEKVLDLVPQRRFLDAEEIAFCVLFLCSPLARGITGADIVVDAGQAGTRFPRGLLMKQEEEGLDYRRIKDEVYAMR